MRGTIPVSVLIPAKNEEKNLPACLESLRPAAEIFVVDSHSTDRTGEIAEAHGAQVVQFDFNGRWPKKKNWALESLPFAHEWVLIVDGDERIPPDLWAEIDEAIRRGDRAGYYLNRRVLFLGTWIKHGGKYPDWNLRLFKHRLGRYEDLGVEEAGAETGDNEVHEHVVMEQAAGYLEADMLHEDFRDLFHWLERHNRYSNWEARLYAKELAGGDTGAALRGSALRDPVLRKRLMRRIWVRLPARPLLRFLITYVVRGGFRDGRAGYIYARLLSQYEFQIAAKLYELQAHGGTLNPSRPDP